MNTVRIKLTKTVEIPEGWELVPVGEECQDDYKYYSKITEEWESGGFTCGEIQENDPHIREISQREISQRELSQKEIDQREIDQREIDQKEIDQKEIGIGIEVLNRTVTLRKLIDLYKFVWVDTFGQSVGWCITEQEAKNIRDLFNKVVKD